MDKEMFEEVRFLLNFKMDAHSPMALILVGQNELWDRLQLQMFMPFRRRIDLQCKLVHYDRAQVGAYMDRHLEYASVSRDNFSDGEVDEIYRYSRGAVRLVNNAIIHSLIFGALNKYQIIDDHLVIRVTAGELT
ncbi:hypothetical protein [Tumebacillus lipolyticus]|uniref:Uncharacterized protein n=1 Tax=Tumebacillus lipolyticus TaxID=1280370 RepID=A0ABW4ZZQ5_9BACL